MVHGLPFGPRNERGQIRIRGLRIRVDVNRLPLIGHVVEMNRVLTSE